MDVRTICHLQAAWETRDFAIATAHGSRHVRCKSEDAAAVGSTGIEKCNKFIRAQGVTVKSPFKGRFSFWGRNPKSKKLVGTGFPTFVDSYPGSHMYIYIFIRIPFEVLLQRAESCGMPMEAILWGVDMAALKKGLA